MLKNEYEYDIVSMSYIIVHLLSHCDLLTALRLIMVNKQAHSNKKLFDVQIRRSCDNIIMKFPLCRDEIVFRAYTDIFMLNIDKYIRTQSGLQIHMLYDEGHQFTREKIIIKDISDVMLDILCRALDYSLRIFYLDTRRYFCRLSLSYDRPYEKRLAISVNPII